MAPSVRSRRAHLFFVAITIETTGSTIELNCRDSSLAPCPAIAVPIFRKGVPHGAYPGVQLCPAYTRAAMNRVILITGGGRGIGAATARLAARRGYIVCISYVSNESAAKGVAGEIRREGGRAVIAQADVSVESQVVRLFETVDH